MLTSLLVLAAVTATAAKDLWGCSHLERTDDEDADSSRAYLMRQAMEQDAMFRQLKYGLEPTRNAAHRCVLKKKKKKLKALKKAAVAHGHVALHAELVGAFGNDPDGLHSCGSEAVDARHAVDLLVPANITLRTLHTDALAPALGWKRRYHAYMFTHAADGSQFGIADDHPALLSNGGNGPTDLMHMHHHGYEVIDDRTVRLSQVLKGSQLLWLYDLGEQWNYTITVTAVSEVPIGQIYVEDAVCPEDAYSKTTRICPPEDAAPDTPQEGMVTHDGVDDWCEMVGAKWRARREFIESNYQTYGQWLSGTQPGITYDRRTGHIHSDSREASRNRMYRISSDFAFRRVRGGKAALIQSAQDRVDDAARQPPGDDDDAHPAAHPYSQRYRDINPHVGYMGRNGHSGQYHRLKEMGQGNFEEPSHPGWDAQHGDEELSEHDEL